MIVKKLQWGYDGGGFACGPVSGSDIVEVTFTEGDKKKYVFVSLYCEFEKVLVHSKSLFKAAINQEFDTLLAEQDKAELALDYELPELPDEMKESPYYPAIKLARMAMKAWQEKGEHGEMTAKEFLAPYVGKEAEELALEDVFYWEDEDEEYDEEDGEE